MMLVNSIWSHAIVAFCVLNAGCLLIVSHSAMVMSNTATPESMRSSLLRNGTCRIVPLNKKVWALGAAQKARVTQWKRHTSSPFLNTTALCQRFAGHDSDLTTFVKNSSKSGLWGGWGAVNQHLAGAYAAGLGLKAGLEMHDIVGIVVLSDETDKPSSLAHGAVWQLFLLSQPSTPATFWDMADRLCLNLPPKHCSHAVGHGSFLLAMASHLPSHGLNYCPQLLNVAALPFNHEQRTGLARAGAFCMGAARETPAEACLSGMYMSAYWYIELPSPWINLCERAALPWHCIRIVRGYSDDLNQQPLTDASPPEAICRQASPRIFIPCVAAMSTLFFRLYSLSVTTDSFALKGSGEPSSEPQCWDERPQLAHSWSRQSTSRSSVASWCARVGRIYGGSTVAKDMVIFACVAGIFFTTDFSFSPLSTGSKVSDTLLCEILLQSLLPKDACLRIINARRSSATHYHAFTLSKLLEHQVS